MKKFLLVASALTLGFSVASTSFAWEQRDTQLDLGEIIEEITESVHGLDLLAVNAAVNTADINSSVTIEANGSLQSAFPTAEGLTGDLGNIDDTLATFVNKIDTVAIGAYANGSTELAAATKSFDAVMGVTSNESFDISGSYDSADSGITKYIRDTINDTTSISLNAVVTDDFTLNKEFNMTESGLLGDTIAINTALNTGDIDASVYLGGEIEGGFHTLDELAAVEFTNVQISTQAIGAYSNSVINVGFSDLALAVTPAIN